MLDWEALSDDPKSINPTLGAVSDGTRLPKGIRDTSENRGIRWQKAGKYYTNADAITLYHGTTEDKLSSIREKGLRYGNLTPSKVEAMNIAKIRREGKKPIVLEAYVLPGHIYPVFHGPKGVATDALSIAIPIEPNNLQVVRSL